MNRQIIFDTETTGLNPKDGHRIIEIGCVELINRKLTGNNFHYYLNPDRDIDEEAVRIHGLTRHFLSKKPSFNHIVSELLDYISGAELIAHNADFDVRFLNHELELAQDKLNKLVKVSDYSNVLDTLVLAKKLHPGQRNSLDALCKRYNVNNEHRELHGALLDAHLLADVYLAMTGGQSSFEFFNDGISLYESGNYTGKKFDFDAKKYNLKVLKADIEELMLHDKFLEKYVRSE